MLHVGITRVLTPGQADELDGGAVLYCAHCWEPHPLDTQLPKVCAHCDSLMLIVKHVSMRKVRKGRFMLVLRKAQDEILQSMAQVANEELFAAEDKACLAALDEAVDMLREFNCVVMEPSD